MKQRIYIQVCLLVLMSSCAEYSYAAPPAKTANVNPSSEDATLPLAVHGDGVSANLQSMAQERFKIALANIPPAYALFQKSQVIKIDPQDLGKANVAVSQMRRLAEQLMLLGEPAGPEFNRRSTISAPIHAIAQSYAATSEGTVYLAKIRQMISNSAKPRAAAVHRAEELADKEKWEEAEKTIYDMIDKLDSITVFLPLTEQEVIYEPFTKVRGRVGYGITQLRRKAAADLLAERVEKQSPDLDALLTEIESAAQSIRTAGTAKIAEEELSGPEAFASLVGRWEKAHAAVLRLQGTYLISRGDTSDPKAPPQPVIARYLEKFTGEVTAALASIIMADAARATPQEAEMLYPAYVRAAALPSARAASGVPAKTFAAALSALAAKSPSLQTDVNNYAAATDELLRWRHRTAVAQAQSKEQAFAPALTPFHAATTSKMAYQAMFVEVQPDYEIPRILSATPEFLPNASQQLLKQKVRLNGARALAGGKTALTTLDKRTYATYKTFPEALAAHVEQLESDLQVSEDSPPLTLEAAMACETAKLGDFEQVGGEIAGVYVEGYITRLAALPEVAAPLVPLGTVPTNNSQNAYSSLLSQAVVRFELKPKWVQHRAFFAVLP